MHPYIILYIYRRAVQLLVGGKYTLKNEDQTATSHFDQEGEGVEAGLATQQMLQEVVLALGVSAEEVTTMELTGTITDQEEMVITSLVRRAKIEDSQVTKYQEMDQMKQIRWFRFPDKGRA
ncbi:hypothetical protein OIU79_007083 [Salix purpurea]|uniref:Uncharacterized protein n=1 Tax=Salix purpurea TaxID=77065 RepID=A0A9Q0Z2X7_SALPP|nr:hypothetical protein OIU79_007083 [Salix purpurea]